MDFQGLGLKLDFLSGLSFTVLVSCTFKLSDLIFTGFVEADKVLLAAFV